MILKSERLPGEAEETINAGEKRVKLIFASSHSIPKVGEFSLFGELLGDDGEEESLPEYDETCDEDAALNESELLDEHLVSEDDSFAMDFDSIEITPEIQAEMEPGKEALNERLSRILERFFDEKIPQQDEDTDKYILRCRGVMSERDGNIVIRYNEDESGGMGATQSEIVIPGDRQDMVSIIRTGGVVNTLVCEKGKRHISAYRTPVMPFEVCVFTKECENTVSFETGGSIFLNYYVELRGTEMQHTKMRITIRVE